MESILKKVSHTELSADDLIDIARATSISEAIDYVALTYIISNINDDQFEDNFNFGMNFSEAVKKASELGIAFDHEEFGFIFFDADGTNCNINGYDTLFGIGSNSYKIKQSIVSNAAGIENKDEYKYSYARVLFDETEGMNFDIAANREVFVEDVLNYIYGKVPTEAGAYDAIIATGYSTVVLDKPLTEHDMELAEKRYDDPEYVFSDEEVKSCADTDRDGLFDFEEVMFYSDCAEENKFIKFNNGNIELPQVADIMHIFEVNGIYAYVDGGVEEARKQYGDCWAIFLTEPVLPIISDPTSVDGDGDGYSDKIDRMPLIWEVSSVSLKNTDYVGYKPYVTSEKAPSYGGKQKWFEEDILIYGPYLATIGCGLVASCDTIIYLKQQQSLNIPKTRTEYSQFALNYFIDYITLYDINQGKLELLRNRFEIGGFMPGHLCNSIQKYLKDENIMNTDCRFKYFDFTDKDTFSRDMYKMLESDIPVIVRVGVNNVETESQGKFNWHYIVITEMNVDYANSNTVLKFSSWGVEYTINLDKLYIESGLQLTGGYVYFEN